MKRIFFIILTLFVFQFGFSQTEKLLKGKVSDKELPIQGVDVINYTTQKSTVTNRDGVFYIEAKPNDILLVYRKNYLDRKIVLSDSDIASADFTIELIPKTIELNEVVINNKPSNEFKVTRAEINEWKVKKDVQSPKVVGINDGSIPNGLNILALGVTAVVYAVKGVKAVFKSDSKAPKNKVSKSKPAIAFKKYVAVNFKQDYFSSELKLQPDEIPLFIDFCDADSKSKTILAEGNVLSVMDFLFAKNIEFKKMGTLPILPK